jgi:hypothetical protein
MVRLRIDQHGGVTTIISGNLPQHEAQYIINTIASATHVQASHTDSHLGILVPDVDDNETLLDDMEADEVPDLYV